MGDNRQRHPQWPPVLKQFWLVAGCTICLLWGLGIADRLTPPYDRLCDYVQEWTSGRNYLHGRPIYRDLTESVAEFLNLQMDDPMVEVNAHPPSSVLLVLPFSLFDYVTSFLLWTAGSLVCLAASIWLVFRREGLDYSPWYLLPLGALLITSNPLNQQLNHGQLNLALLLMITLAWDTFRRGRDAASGTLVGLATAVKLFPGYLLVFYLAQRRWKAASAVIASFLVATGLTALVLGPDVFTSYAFDVLPRVGEFRDYWPNVSLAGYWSRLLSGPSGHAVPLIRNETAARAAWLACSALVTLAVAWKAWQARTLRQRDVAFSACLIGMLLVSPITWDHYYLILLVPYAVLWKYAPGPWHKAFLLGTIVILFTIYSRWIWDATIPGEGELAFLEGLEPSVAATWHVVTVLAYHTYTLLALLIYTLLVPVVAAGSEECTEERQPTSAEPRAAAIGHSIDGSAPSL